MVRLYPQPDSPTYLYSPMALPSGFFLCNVYNAPSEGKCLYGITAKPDASNPLLVASRRASSCFADSSLGLLLRAYTALHTFVGIVVWVKL